jgi:S-adenosylmethionine hydrolase
VKSGEQSKLNKQGVRANRLPVSTSGPITLLTDFGTADYYVGAMKGVILSINPSAEIVDITHDVPPQNTDNAAFVLVSCYRDFPAGTIHVAVVDPGVGSNRRPIVISAGEQYFVGPDNGLFSYVLDKEENAVVWHITANAYLREPLSNTFHGRDVFAPVAAELSKGMSVTSVGPRIEDPVRLRPLKAAVGKDGNVTGRIIHIDRFGNCVTNIDQDWVGAAAELLVHGKRITSFQHSYADGKTELFGICGSAGFIEISARNGSAAKTLKARCLDEVTLIVKQDTR